LSLKITQHVCKLYHDKKKKKKYQSKGKRKLHYPIENVRREFHSPKKKKNKEEVKSLEQQTYFPMAWKRLLPITYIM
jgi:hypothetical protein